jgi:hypothetical protein
MNPLDSVFDDFMLRMAGRATRRRKCRRSYAKVIHAHGFYTEIADLDCYASILVNASRIPDSIRDLKSNAASGIVVCTVTSDGFTLTIPDPLNPMPDTSNAPT